MPITNEMRELIFNRIKSHLKIYTPPLVVKHEVDNETYEVIGNVAVPYGYDKKLVPGMFFATLAQRKDSVTFHFFPAYMHPGLKEMIPLLYKYLKGKTCFHFKKLEQVNEAELEYLLKEGMRVWKKQGYIQ